VPRVNVDTELKQRADDCMKCLSVLARGSQKTLRDFGPEEVDELMGSLPESVRRRCLHVVEEIVRVAEAEEALIRGDAASFGRAVNKSHASLRNLYEVSCPEIDWLAKRALEIDGVLCSRLTGKGFGGCTVTVMAESSLPEYRKRLEDYERIFGFRPTIHETRLAGGLRVVG
jgi:galactokinase